MTHQFRQYNSHKPLDRLAIISSTYRICNPCTRIKYAGAVIDHGLAKDTSNIPSCQHSWLEAMHQCHINQSNLLVLNYKFEADFLRYHDWIPYELYFDLYALYLSSVIYIGLRKGKVCFVFLLPPLYQLGIRGIPFVEGLTSFRTCYR